MKGFELLSHYENKWVTDMGAWFPGQKVILRGQDLFQEYGEKSWMVLLVFSITGRKVNNSEASLLESIWNISTSYPDPRLWNNRIAALSGTARSTCALAISNSIAVSEASIFGGQPILRITQLLIELKNCESPEIEKNLSIYLNKYRAIPGFGRPLIKHDERIKPVLATARKLDLASGKCLQLVSKIESSDIAKKYKLSANIAAIYGALMADMGFSALEAYQLSVLAFSAGMFPCYIDAINKPAGAFFPIAVKGIHYQGKDERKWEL